MSGLDSETDDSDVESSLVAWMDAGVSTNTCHSASAGLRKAVTEAIHFLQNVQLTDLDASQEELHREILKASHMIDNYLDGLKGHRPDAVKELDLFALLVRPTFIQVLFAQRRMFHNIAIKALLPGTTASIVVCWVDEHLAKLADTTAMIITFRSFQNRVLSDAMKARFEDDGLRASAQLPGEATFEQEDSFPHICATEKWAQVPSVISSVNASPAAKRLAIRLTFAVYDLGPRLKKFNPWIHRDTPTAAELLKILDQYILVTPVDQSISYSDQELTQAMIVSLYAISDSEQHHHRIVSPFRPRTLGSLLDMISLVMHWSGFEEEVACIKPCEELDAPQMVLLQSSNILWWIWETWNDYRVAGAESITKLTATWLFHLHDISARMSCDQPAASYAILPVMHHSIQTLVGAGYCEILPTSFFVVLTNACRTVHQLLHNQLISGRILGDATAITKCLLGLFILLNQKPELQSAILESLTMVDDPSFDKALQSILHDQRARFVERIDELILHSRRKLMNPGEPRVDLSSDSVQEVRLILDFLIRISHSRESQGRVQRSPILNLLLSVTQQVLQADLRAGSLNHFRDTIIAGFYVLQTDPTSSIKRLKQEDLWGLALDAGCSNLGMASSFAHHIVATERLPDSLLCTEAWDNLRDTLILILRSYYAEEEKPLAILVSSVICGALVRLLDADLSTVNLILTSPWTMSLCAELKRFAQNETRPEGEYFRLLQSQLVTISEVLLAVIRAKLDCRDTPAVDGRIPRLESRLLYYGRHPDCSLVLVPRLLG
ncbi:hypothetical protein D9757_002798 [Collybiopsis confluens]|uniref:Uncharacterized protein n=1 Tax=Collybiopsis confluens TaxID=2823264 RepID=A0A8H5HVK3_9AGAR|nr:hypothetical protein D9757_002798 [Collybiopsis confluens]